MRRVAFVAVVAFLCRSPRLLLFTQFPPLARGSPRANSTGAWSTCPAPCCPVSTITVTDEATGLVRTVPTNESGRFVLVAMQPGLYTMKAELAGFQTQTRTGIRLGVGQAITLAYTLAGRDAGRCNHGERGRPARRGDPDHHRHQHVGAGHHEPAHAGARDAVVDGVGAGVDAATGQREFRGGHVQRERPRGPEQSVPGGRRPQQGRSRGGVHAGQHDHRRLLRVQRDDARLRGGIRRGLRRHRQRGDQERDESVSRQWVLLRAGRPLQRHQLLLEAGRPGQAGERQRYPGREHRRADPPEQGVLLFQHRAAVAQERARPEVSRGGGAPGDLLREHLRRQPHQVLRAGGLPADPVE